MTSLHVICGLLPPPPIKNPRYACDRYQMLCFKQQQYQRWSPRGRARGHSFKSLASKPQVLKNCPVLGSRTALFFEWLKFCRSAEKCFSRPFFWRSTEKKILRPFFLGKHLHLCPWSLASSIPVLDIGLGFFLCPWPWPWALCPRLHLWTVCIIIRFRSRWKKQKEKTIDNRVICNLVKQQWLGNCYCYRHCYWKQRSLWLSTATSDIIKIQRFLRKVLRYFNLILHVNQIAKYVVKRSIKSI